MLQYLQTRKTMLFARAFEPLDASSYVVFRVLFGIALLVEVCRYFIHDWIGGVYITPPFHFKFYGFEWVHPLPAEGMYLLFLAIGLASITFAIGWHSQASALVLFASLSYVLLLEKAVYLNHLYLICLLTLTMSTIPSLRIGFTSWNSESDPHRRTIPAIAMWAMRLQIAIPYIYGALAKLNGDWLSGQPMQLWMSRMTHVKTWCPAFGEMWLALIFSYGGFLFDLCVVPFLLLNRTRRWAFAAAVAFHVCNSVLFRIGIFPWLMIAATTLYFSPSWPHVAFSQIQSRFLRIVSTDTRKRRLANPQRNSSISIQTGELTSAFKGRIVCVFFLWFGIQLIVPFRHALYPGRVDWTEEGTQFSWRMMLNDKAAVMQILIVDPQTNRVITPLNPGQYLTEVQVDKMSYDPDLLIQFCRYAGSEIQRVEGREIAIKAIVYCSLNGRKPQLLIDPSIDLSRQPRTLAPLRCIVPLTEPFLKEAFSLPPNSWFSSGKIESQN